MAEEAPPIPSVAPPMPRRTPIGRRIVRWLAGVLGLIVLLALAAVGTAWWAVHDAPATAWLLARIPNLSVAAPKGALMGEFSADAVEYRVPSSGRVRIDDLAWRGLRLESTPPGLNWRVAIDRLRAGRVEWIGEGAPAKAPPRPPRTLRIPVEIDIATFAIGEIRTGADDAGSVLDLQGALHLGADRGSVHRIDKATLSYARMRISASAQIATEAPLQLDARIEATQNAGPDSVGWSATANAAGPLAAPLVQATVRATAVGGRPTQALDARATLKPFEPWPLGDLELAAKALDLSAFHASLPATALNGTAIARTRGTDQPALVTAQLQNGTPGRWSDGRLPLRTLELDVRARPDDLRSFSLQSFSAELGSQDRAAGRLVGRGGWTGDRWNVELQLTDVQPALLDARAPPMTIAGQLALQASAPTAAASAPPIEVKANLQGRLAERGPARAVELKVDGSVAADRIELRSAEARAGGAIAAIDGTAVRRAADAPWRLNGRATLTEFDPTAWWPGADNTTWRKGPHRLNAKGTFDLTVPATFGGPAWYETLAALRGDAAIDVGDSLVAGVTVKGAVKWHNGDGRAAVAVVDLNADGNSLKVDGRVGLGHDGAGDAWDAAIAAPALARLAPLWRLLAADRRASPASAPPVSGALNANAHVSGRWPLLTTHGQLEGSSLRIGDLTARKAQAQWQLGTAAQAPIEVKAAIDQAAFGDTEVAALDVRLNGTAQAHTIDARADSKAALPAWTASLRSPANGASAPVPAPAASTAAAQPTAATAAAGNPALTASAPARTAAPLSSGADPVGAASPASGPAGAPPYPAQSRAIVQARGSLIGSPTHGISGWRGLVQQIEWRPSAARAAPWIRARDVGIETQWTDGPARVLLEPGRAEILGAGLRWSRFAWQAGNGERVPMRIDVQADLDPLPIAPLLRRAQPDFGWGGDLTIAGRFDIRSAPTVQADVVIERKSGDLTVTDEEGTRALGLTDLRVGLAAADGVWNFTQALAGTTVGVGAGAIVARTPPGATWPTAATPIEGVMELRVADLGTWGPWLPAGWRLGGELHFGASLGGRLGAPEYTGDLSGRALSVRNFLQGVAVGDGDVKVALQGVTARIDRFSARAGSGSVTLEGGASFGESPQARVKLIADRFQVLGRVDRRIVASGNAQLRLDRDLTALEGAFAIDEGLIDFSLGDAPTLASDVQVVRTARRDDTGRAVATNGASARGAPPTAAQRSDAGASNGPPSSAPNSSRKLSLDLRVDMGEHLRIRGRGLDSGLRGELRITSPANRMAVNGTVYTVDGTYAAYGQKLAIDRGQLTFSGAVENPRLDIEATRPNLDIRVGVAVTGTALIPRVRLFSEPELSEMDKLSWLVLGRASEGLGRTDTALLQRAALALLAGESGGGTGQLTKAIGLDEVSVRQGEGEVRETIVSLGKQLSQRWYVGYERGLNATAGSWQLIYRIAQRFTLRAQSGIDNSLDLIWSWRWQ